MTETNTDNEILVKRLWQLLEEVKDPEVPVLSVIDLGIIRKIEIVNSRPLITITPTYSGCPAMDMIRMNIRLKLMEHGINDAEVVQVLSPAWTTDWMSEEGKRKLKEFGIAPPLPKQVVCDTAVFQEEEAIECPHCGSFNTELVSRFGSTACKAQYRCKDCKEPFDYFKCH